MYKAVLLFALFIFSTSMISFADDVQQVITLKDGSQIKGVLAGVNNGIYTVKTPIIGDVHVSAGDVASITNGNAAPAAAPAANSAPGAYNPFSQVVASAQPVAFNPQQLMSNPQSMAIIQQMAQDPEVLEALQDPALVQAVQNHDLQSVQNNPGVQKIINDPKLRAMLLQLAAQQQQQAVPSK